MHLTIRTMALLCFSVPLLAAAQSSSVVLPQDKGPDKIDVSKYPPDQQKEYKLFAEKCSKCHTIARPINTSMLWQQWDMYGTHMMHKPASGISETQGKAIIDFLIYDQKYRKNANASAFFPALSDEELAKLKTK